MPNWSDVLKEIGSAQNFGKQLSHTAVDSIRQKHLKLLQGYTKRNIICYYSGFLSKPGYHDTELNDEDKNGFMMAVHGMDRNAGLDLFLHTPGGGLEAAKSIVHYLRQMFGRDIRAIVPQISMSAGTMLACACKSIVMGKQSNLGPVDPQIRGIPAAGVVEEFKRAYAEIKKDPQKISVWEPVLRQYHPTFLLKCENVVKWSKAFVGDQLGECMFHGARGKARKITKIVNEFSNYKRGHDRHIHMDECQNTGLIIEPLEDNAQLQDLVLTVHHCYMHSLMNSSSLKIIENHDGAALVKHAPQKKAS